MFDFLLSSMRLPGGVWITALLIICALIAYALHLRFKLAMARDANARLANMLKSQEDGMARFLALLNRPHVNCKMTGNVAAENGELVAELEKAMKRFDENNPPEARPPRGQFGRTPRETLLDD